MISGVDYIEELRVVLNKTDNSYQSTLMSEVITMFYQFFRKCLI